jgi:hypothetical protein
MSQPTLATDTVCHVAGGHNRLIVRSNERKDILRLHFSEFFAGYCLLHTPQCSYVGKKLRAMRAYVGDTNAAARRRLSEKDAPAVVGHDRPGSLPTHVETHARGH